MKYTLICTREPLAEHTARTRKQTKSLHSAQYGSCHTSLKVSIRGRYSLSETALISERVPVRPAFNIWKHLWNVAGR